MCRWHELESKRLPELRSNLADQFIGGYPLTDRQLEGLANRVADLRGNIHRRLARAGQIKISLVDRPNLHVRCKIVRIRKHEPRKELVFFKITRQQDELGTEPPRHGAGHGGV